MKNLKIVVMTAFLFRDKITVRRLCAYFACALWIWVYME
jgi:hypothetical protein